MGDSIVKVYKKGFNVDERVRQIDQATEKTIESRYPVSEELRIIRKALVSMKCKEPEFLIMNNYIESVINSAALDKSEIVATPKIITSPAQPQGTYPPPVKKSKEVK